MVRYSLYLNVISMSKRSLEKMLTSTSNNSISSPFDRLRRFLKVLEQSITRNQSNYTLDRKNKHLLDFGTIKKTTAMCYSNIIALFIDIKTTGI